MKYLLPLVTFFFTGLFTGKAQCIANAGNDTVICLTLLSYTPFQIGGNPTASGGSGNYNYLWDVDGFYSASDFLDDITSANPVLESPPNGISVFYVQVTDDEGNSCEDSVVITMSEWLCNLGVCIYMIEAGDTVQLWTGCASNFPLSYIEWSPQEFLSDPFIANPLAFPTANTTYSVTITDSVGCQMVNNCDVFVSPSSVSENTISEFSATVFPNPIEKSSVIQFYNPDHELLTIGIFNSIGANILNATTQLNLFEIGRLIDKSGEYFYRISFEAETVYRGRFTIN